MKPAPLIPIKNAKAAPSIEQLREMAKHVEYEMCEFRTSAEHFERLKGSPSASDHERNRALESALLHFRILRDFFLCPRKPSQDDVLAEHYCDQSSWKPLKLPVFEATRKNLDKRLAHLTLARLGLKNWHELPEMHKAVEANLSRFLSFLSPLRKQWFPLLSRGPFTVTLTEADNSTASVSILPSLIDDKILPLIGQVRGG